MTSPLRHLVLVLGDQLSLASPAFAGFDAERDALVMIEAAGEAEHVWSHKGRIAISSRPCATFPMRCGHAG